MSKPLAHLAPLPIHIEISETFRQLHGDLSTDDGYLSIAKHFALDKVTDFLDQLKKYNSAFTRVKVAPNPGEKEELASAIRYPSLLSALTSPTRWKSAMMVYPSQAEALSKIADQWQGPLRRTLLSSYHLNDIVEEAFLDDLQTLAKRAIRQLRWRSLGEGETVKLLYRQFIRELTPFAKGEILQQERCHLVQDALARLTVSLESNDPRYDDVLFHVAHTVEKLKVPVVTFLSAEEMDAASSTGLTKPISKMSFEQREKIARDFLAKPHSRSISPSLFSGLIHVIEKHGNNAQKASLYQLPLFQEKEGALETINRAHGKYRVVIPKNVGAYIPRFKILPWLFQDAARRYDFFKDKQWLIQLIKHGLNDFLNPDVGILLHPAARQKMDSLQHFIALELEDIQSKIKSVHRWNKKSHALLKVWKTMVTDVQEKIVTALSAPVTPSDEVEAVEEPVDLQEALDLVDEGNAEKNKGAFSGKEKRILKSCTTIFCSQSCDDVDAPRLTEILSAFRDAYAAKKPDVSTSHFHHACRKHANEIFKYIADHFESLSKKDWVNFDAATIATIFNEWDLFSQVTHLITQKPGRKAFSASQYHRYESMLERVLTNQLISICKNVELLTENVLFTGDAAENSKKSYRELIEQIKQYLLPHENLSEFQELCDSLLEKLNDSSNRNFIQIRFSSVREFLEARNPVPLPRIANLQPGIFYSEKNCGAQSPVTNSNHISQSEATCVL